MLKQILFLFLFLSRQKDATGLDCLQVIDYS
jgi:hypothetical protein